MFRRWLVVTMVAVTFTSFGSASAQTQDPRNHLTLSVGYMKLTSDALEGSTYWPDMSSTLYGSIAYRHRLRPNVDITVDWRNTVATGTFTSSLGTWDWTMTTTQIGPGFRYTGNGTWIRPYGQLNFFFLGAGGDQPTSFDDVGGVGLGLSAGVDLRVSRTISIPVEAVWTPGEDLGGYGANAGLGFNW